MKFRELDPTQEGRATEIARLQQTPTLGVEVTVPALAAACVANIDPQHSGGNTRISAVEATTAIVTGKAPIATVRSDLDSLSTAAIMGIVLELVQRSRTFSDDMLHRIELIGIADRFDRGDWPGVQPLPTPEKPWSESTAAAEDTRELAAIGAAVANRKLPLDDRIEMLKTWLLTGQEPSEYRKIANAKRLEMVTALAKGEVSIQTFFDGRVALVTSTYRGAMSIGYKRAPIVLAVNPNINQSATNPMVKMTVAQFCTGYIDLLKLWPILANMESGWGGSPNVGGSPQNETTNLSPQAVLEAMHSCLLK